MGERREPRTETKLPVRIFGTDANGQVFSENVFTLDISHSGAKLSGVQAQIKPGEIIGITHGQHRSRFSVKWVGRPGTPQAGQIGVLNVAPEKYIWDVSVPAAGIDAYGRTSSSRTDRRQHARMKCTNSVQLQPEGQAAPIWGKISDLSSGGCFVEMPNPLPRGTKLRIGLWLNENKLLLKAKVMNSRPGFGIGIQFTEVSDGDAEQLRRYLQSITHVST
jgi:hypothetical protein